VILQLSKPVEEGAAVSSCVWKCVPHFHPFYQTHRLDYPEGAGLGGELSANNLGFQLPPNGITTLGEPPCPNALLLIFLFLLFFGSAGRLRKSSTIL
jgi:hypothetical protein